MGATHSGAGGTSARDRIENSLRDSFRQAELVNYEIRQSDLLEVVATVRQPVANLDSSGEIIAARDSLEELLDQPVKLSVVNEPRDGLKLSPVLRVRILILEIKVWNHYSLMSYCTH